MHILSRVYYLTPRNGTVKKSVPPCVFLARRRKSGTKSREQMFVGATGCNQGTLETLDPLLVNSSTNYSKYTMLL